jgi:hypothetical protein
MSSTEDQDFENWAFAMSLIANGYCRRDDAIEALVSDCGEGALDRSTAQQIVDEVWQERLAEEATWPERTDVDSLEEAFAALEAQGIVTRANFACCTSCGHRQIRDERAPDSTGYVFFDAQSTDSAVESGALWVHFGAYRPEQERATAAIGQKAVTALAAAGLPVTWNGSGDTTIKVAPITWQKRVPR